MDGVPLIDKGMGALALVGLAAAHLILRDIFPRK